VKPFRNITIMAVSGALTLAMAAAQDQGKRGKDRSGAQRTDQVEQQNTQPQNIQPQNTQPPSSQPAPYAARIRSTIAARPLTPT